jgi:hypothetical protein
LSPYSIHQRNAVKKKDDENQVDYFQRLQHNPALIVPRPVLQYWKLRAFNHELSSEQITIEWECLSEDLAFSGEQLS